MRFNGLTCRSNYLEYRSYIGTWELHFPKLSLTHERVIPGNRTTAIGKHVLIDMLLVVAYIIWHPTKP